MSTKVFVGNLAFRTTDQALQEAFAQCGDVKSGVIITRGRRSLGYGFVEFSSTEQAAASVNKMNKSDLFGRQIKVELAKDPAERPQYEEGAETGPARRRRRAGPRGGDGGDGGEITAGGGGKPHTQHPPQHSQLQQFQPQQFQSQQFQPQQVQPQHFQQQQQYQQQQQQYSPQQNVQGDRNSEGVLRPRRKRTKKAKPVREKIPSKTTLFVANLPFSVDDEQLSKIFEDTKATAAHVVKTRTGRSRGYGFVEFGNEEDQVAALNSHHNKEVEATSTTPTGPVHSVRNISVTISNSVASSVQVGNVGPE